MSASGPKRTFPCVTFDVAFWGKADMGACTAHVRFCPKAHILRPFVVAKFMRHRTQNYLGSSCVRPIGGGNEAARVHNISWRCSSLAAGGMREADGDA